MHFHLNFLSFIASEDTVTQGPMWNHSWQEQHSIIGFIAGNKYSKYSPLHACAQSGEARLVYALLLSTTSVMRNYRPPNHDIGIVSVRSDIFMLSELFRDPGF